MDEKDKEEKQNKWNKIWNNDWLKVGILFSIWRLVIWLVAYIGSNRFFLEKDKSFGWISKNPWIPDISPMWQFFARWDSGWYLSIMERGYFWDGPGTFSNVVFFPLYPITVKVVAEISKLDYLIAGIIVSSIFTYLAAVFLYKLGRLEFDKKKGLRAVFYLLIFPTAFFLATVYSESLFIFTSVASFYFARKKQWFLAGVFGGLTALCRPTGLIMAPVLLLEYFEQNKYKFSKIKANLFHILWIPIFFCLYPIYLWKTFGNPFIFLFSQDIWGRNTELSFTRLWNTLGSHFHDTFLNNGNNPAYVISNGFDFFYFSIFVIFGILVFFLLRKSYGVFMLLYLVIPGLSSSFISMGRFALVLFPIYLLLAKWGKNQVINYGIILLFSMLAAVEIILFVNSYWAG